MGGGGGGGGGKYWPGEGGGGGGGGGGEGGRKYWPGEERGGGSSVFELLAGANHLGGSHFKQSKTELTPTSSKGRQVFEPWLKKDTWLVYNRDGNFMCCKIRTKDN